MDKKFEQFMLIVNKHMKKFSMLVISEIQISTKSIKPQWDAIIYLLE